MENISFRTYCNKKGITGIEREQFWKYLISNKNILADEDFTAFTEEQYDSDYEQFTRFEAESEISEACFDGIELMSQEQIITVLEEIC